ncbi:MAG: signal peptidase II [Ruminococcaceae bacterium]|nr:signal peptidase II [Oscillospiraceae bacterium]
MFVFLCITVGVVFLDQMTKWLAVAFVEGGPSVPFIPWLLRFTYVENTGAAWGMFGKPDQRWIFMTLSTLAIAAVFLYMFIGKPKSRFLTVALAFVVGGGIGNMIDRVLYGYVVDFLDLTFMDFPVFNVADSFVCVGAGMLILYLILDTIKECKDGKKNSDTSDS